MLEGNFILGAEELKYKQTSTTFDQIWLRIWSLKMGPVTTGCWKDPTKSRTPSSLHFAQHTAPLKTSLLTVSVSGCRSATGPSGLTCGCQSASLVRYRLGVSLVPSAQPVCSRKPYQCTQGAAGCRESLLIWNRPRTLRK